ncbi:hypothetical protein HT031_002100 [Scenedesmus sp. PABB004]|nr:hypothetical protein HT031_002100 [Scenedesmus sp. PABB004]
MPPGSTSVKRAPLKRRGLSAFYSSKSQSFGCIQDLLVDAAFSRSSLLLAKRGGSQRGGLAAFAEDDAAFGRERDAMLLVDCASPRCGDSAPGSPFGAPRLQRASWDGSSSSSRGRASPGPLSALSLSLDGSLSGSAGAPLGGGWDRSASDDGSSGGGPDAGGCCWGEALSPERAAADGLCAALQTAARRPRAMWPREIAELCLIVFSFAVFGGYHVWMFVLNGKGSRVRESYNDFFTAGKLARSIWAEACATDEKDAILGVQQARNAMTACSYLAIISVALATAGLTIIFDDAKIQRIRQLNENDAILRHLAGPLLVQPTVTIALSLGALYGSFICFAQSVRLYVHTGFYVRAVTSRFNPGTLTVREAKRVTVRAGVAFSVRGPPARRRGRCSRCAAHRLRPTPPPPAGPPALAPQDSLQDGGAQGGSAQGAGPSSAPRRAAQIMWSIGVTALLVSSVAMTGIIAWMDHFDGPLAGDGPGDEEEGAPLCSVLARESAAHAATAAHAAAAAAGAGGGAGATDGSVRSPHAPAPGGAADVSRSGSAEALQLAQFAHTQQRPPAAEGAGSRLQREALDSETVMTNSMV